MLQLNNISKAFGDKGVLKNISFTLQDKEKAAIIGVNGAGKSTLVKIITGELFCDGGDIISPKSMSIGYLPQIAEIDLNKTVYEELLTVFSECIEIEEKMRALEKEMTHLSGNELSSAMQEYSRLTHSFEEKNGFEYKSRITGVINGLEILDSESDFEKSHKISKLSGGQKTRVLLAKLLLSNPKLLILDEPTNHLDTAAIEWLEGFLVNFPNAILVISHDRYFIDKISTKIIEIENGISSTYNCGYSQYVQEKEQARRLSEKSYEDNQKEVKRQEEVIKKLRQFNREKSIRRANSREKALEKMEKLDKPAFLPESAHFVLAPKKESGKDVLTIKNLWFDYGQKPLIRNVSCEIKKGDKIALIGSNGVGKTTLFNLILGKLKPKAGEIILSQTVTMGYFAQENKLDLNKTIFEEISDAHPNLTNTEIRDTLAAFVFKGDEVFKENRLLSGGEQGRVALAKLMLSSSNFLILDEPTNHLDIVSKEILERALNSYTGTVLFVSHDRYFINSVATKIFELTAEDGGVIEYYGNYDYYKEKRTDRIAEEKIIKEDSAEKTAWQNKKNIEKNERMKKNKLIKLEEEIQRLESEVKVLEERLESVEVCTSPQLAEAAYNEKVELESRLSLLLSEWEENAG